MMERPRGQAGESGCLGLRPSCEIGSVASSPGASVSSPVEWDEDSRTAQAGWDGRVRSASQVRRVEPGV